MKLTGYVFDSAGNQLGIVPLVQAQITRVLNGPGQVSVTVPGFSAAYDSLLAVRRFMLIFVNAPDEEKRSIGVFQIQKIRRATQHQGETTVSGADPLTVLKNRLIAAPITYSVSIGEGIDEIMTQLLAEVGWGIDTQHFELSAFEVRFDGGNYLTNLRDYAQSIGNWFRYDMPSSNSILPVTEYLQVVSRQYNSPNPSDQTVHSFINPKSISGNYYNSPIKSDIFYIQDLTIEDDASQIVNAVLPLGSGEGNAALTLEQSTATDVITITDSNGNDSYWLEDSPSIAQYGRIQQRVDFKHISPPGNDPLSVQFAANRLQSAARTYLFQSRFPVTVYTATVVGLDKLLQPGERVRTKYIRELYDRDGTVAEYQRVFAGGTIEKVVENWSESGGVATVTFAQNGYTPSGAAQTIAATSAKVEVQERGVKNFETTSTFQYERVCNGTYPLEVPIRIDEKFQSVSRCQIYLKRLPITYYTGSGVTQAAQSFTNISVSINGANVNGTYGAPFFPPGSSDTEATLDIADTLNAQSPFQREHIVTFDPAGGQGVLQAVVVITTVQNSGA